MLRLFERINNELQAFLDQRDDAVLVVSTRESEAISVLKTLEGLDDATSWALFWTFTEDYDSPAGYAATLLEAYSARHDGVRLAMKEAGMDPWPALPPHLRDQDVPASERIRHLMSFARSLLPTQEGGLLVWSFFPLEIADAASYARLMAEVTHHERPFPWCHHIRMIIREDKEAPETSWLLRTHLGVRVYEPDVSQEAIQRSLEEELVDEEVPIDRQAQDVLVMAATDSSHKRYADALDKYHAVLPFFAKIQNAPMAAFVLNAIGECHSQLGDPTQAEAYFEYACEPVVDLKAPPIPILLNIFLNLGNLTLSQERWTEAETYYDGAGQMATAQMLPRVLVQALENQGFAQYEQNKVPEALESWIEGARVAKTVEEHDLFERLLSRLRDHCAATSDQEPLRQLERELAATPSAPSSDPAE